jgi:uncharacterized protein (TIGR03000 family)
MLASAALLLAAAAVSAAPPNDLLYRPTYVPPASYYTYPRYVPQTSLRYPNSPYVAPASYYRASPAYYPPTPPALPRSYYNPYPDVARMPGGLDPLSPYAVPRTDALIRPRALREEREEDAGRTARIEVTVPLEAELFFGEARTRQAGSVRRFESPPLEPGRKYAYDVTARWTEGGREVVRKRTVNVTAGARVKVDLTAPE